MKTDPEKPRMEALSSVSSKSSYVRFFTFILVVISLLVILLHFVLFQAKYPAQIGTATTDIVILGIVFTVLFETYHLNKVWSGPFIWINTGILLFFIGSLSELLGEFFIRPSFIRYSAENGAKICAFGALAWGFSQWGKERFEAEKRFERLKKLDSLTGLPDRSSFRQRFELFEKIARRYRDLFSLIYLNIDNFKRYNQDKGEDAGDAVLKRMANLLSKETRGEDFIIRYGGDEFMILVPMMTRVKAKERSKKMAERIRTLVESEFKSEGITISVATALYDEPGKNIFKGLDEAMQRAKASGKN
ncbi:hypothetical protein DRJ00_09250, partial [Candidatus Aerophobetes bacterium]